MCRSPEHCICGCAAKYISLLNNPEGELISRLSYFRDVIEHVLKPIAAFENWPLITVVMTKYELAWCIAYLASVVKMLRLSSCEVEEMLKVPIEEACALSNEGKLRKLTEGQFVRLSSTARTFSAAEHSHGSIALDWLTKPNSHDVFGGLRPVDRMSTDDSEELESICKHVRAVAGY